MRLALYIIERIRQLNQSIIDQRKNSIKKTTMFALNAFIIATLCVAASLQSTPFRPCENKPQPSDLRVKGCEELPCKFVRGENVEAEWDFITAFDTDNLKPVVKAKALGVTTNYPLPEQDACKGLTNAECPLDQGESVTYALSMPILKIFPKVSVQLTFSLVDANEHVHTCFQVDGKVV